MIDFVFLDSGTGGLPYLLYMKELKPSFSCAYVADTKNFPYGQKTHEEIVQGVLDITKKIIEKLSPKVIVIACNTMSVNALDVVREAYPEIKFVGTVPAIKTAGDISKKKCIGLLATNSTINHPYNQDLKNHFASDCKMVLRGDPDLISFIEHKSFTATEEEKINACLPAVNFFRDNGCDVIILGCTHFLNLRDQMQKASEPDITVVDSREGVVNRAISVFGKEGEESRKEEASTLYVTGFSDQKDLAEYEIICKNYNLIWSGKL